MPSIGVVGATGAVGSVTLELLAERGFDQVRAFASQRSAGKKLAGGLVVEEATPEALAAGGLDLCLFSVGTGASLELVPHAVGFRYADPKLEELTAAQKQFLRMGPRNVRIIQQKLRELQPALSAPAAAP